MTEQCKIYLDPWDKDDLEGTAMLINRMPDITDRIYRGVTCQRWLVRFQPDQNNAMRWLDYTDAEPYVFPIADSHLYTFNLTSITRNDASPAQSFANVGQVTARWYAASHISAFILPRDGRLAGIDFSYITVAATGGAALTYIGARRNDGLAQALILHNSTTVGGPYARSYQTEDIKAYAKGDRLTLALYQPQPAGEEITLSDIIATVHIAWGEFA